MADGDYLPPIISEIIIRTQGFATGAAQIRSEMVSTAATLDAEADKASQSTLKIGESAQSAADLASRANLKIVTSAREAGAAAAAQAAEMGKSSTEIAAAAGRAAEEYTVAQSKMTTAQKAAGLAAAEGAAAAKAGADEQEAAYARAAAAAEVEGERISASQKYLGESLANSGLAIGGALGRPLRGFGRQIEETQHQARSFVGTLSEIGKVVTYGGILGFVGAAYEGVKAATAYQTSLAQIAADSGQGNANAIGKAFLGTLGSSAFSAAQLAQSYAQVSQQLKVVEGGTLNAAAAMKVMAASSDLAKGAQTDLGTATSAVAQVMQAYHLGVSQASQASDALYSTSRATDSSVSSIAGAMAKLHARLGEVTPSLKDVGGLMVSVAQTGLTGSRGILQVSSAMQNLLGGSTAVGNQLAKMHVGLTNASGGFVGMKGAISELHSAFQGMSPSMQLFAADTLFGKGAAQTMLQVIDKGTASFQKDAQAADRAGSAHAAAAAQGKTLTDQLEVIKATLDDLAVAFGQVFIPILQKAGTIIASVVNWFEKNKAAAIALAAVVSGVLGAAVAVFVTSKVVGLIKGTEDMVAGFSKVGAAITNGLIPQLERSGLGLHAVGVASDESVPQIESLGAVSEATGAEVTGLGDQATVAGGQMALFGDETEAAGGQLALFVTEAEGAGGAITGVGAAAAGVDGEVAGLTTRATGLLGVLTKLADIGTIAITIAVAFKGIGDIIHSLKHPGIFSSPEGNQLALGSTPSGMGIPGEGRHARIEGIMGSTGDSWAQAAKDYQRQLAANAPGAGVTKPGQPGYIRGPSAAALRAADRVLGAGSTSSSSAVSQLQQAAAAQQRAAAAQTEASRVISRYQYAAQDTGVAPLEKVLGINQRSIAAQLHAAIMAGKPTTGILAGAEGGKAQAGYEREITQMHKQGLDKLIPQLVAAHKAALDALSQQLVAQQALKDSTTLTLESTALTDQTKAAQDAAATEVSVVKDQQAIVSAAMQAAAKNISDSASVMSARLSAAATAITDASTVGQDRSSAMVTAMSDATKVQADILGERMLYGYELVAQRLQVQLDATKEGFDKQIAVAQEHLDEDKQHWDGKIAAATINVARVTQHEDQLVAMAQQRELIVQAHADTLLGNAQQQSDTAQLAADMKVALAQNAVTLSQSATPAQKQAAENMLTLAQAQSGVGTANAAAALEKVTASTTLATTQAAGAYQKAQDSASIAEAKSSATLAHVQGEALISEAKTQAAMTRLTDAMNKVEQRLQDQITLAQAGGGRRIKSDATSLAYTGLGSYGKGGGGNIVNNLGPAATGVGIAQETATERRRARGGKERKGGDVHIHGNVNVHGSTDQQRHDWYLQTRSSMGSLVS